MSIERRVRKLYERYPYPPPPSRLKPTWALPSVRWIDALREARKPLDPRRILVAGCGAGTEAFMFARQFPRAELVAVDFSDRSITTANRLLRKTRLGGRLRFAAGDLTSPSLLQTTGGDFDLITCHGVLSYIPDAPAVFRNFARALSSDGVLVLGVNGAGHPSVRHRKMLPSFGIDPEEFAENERMRQVIRIFDYLIEYPRLPMADREPGYLAGDIFGPVNLALPLAEWTAMLDGARLHMLGTYHAYYATRALFNHDLHLTMMPRSRREVSELADALQPSSFHQIVVSGRAPAPVPWSDPKELMRWRPARTRLFTFRWPRSGSAPQNLRTVTMRSSSTRTKVELRIPQWEVEALRRADGRQSLRQLLATVKPRVGAKSVSEAMYLLYLMGALNLVQPE